MSELDNVKKELFKNKEISEFCLKNKITDDQLLNSFPDLFLHKDNSEICKKCLGKKPCESKVENMQTVLTYDNSKIKVHYKDCPYIKKVSSGKLTFLNFNDNIGEEEVIISNERILILNDLQRFYNEYKKGKKVKGTYIYGNYGSGKTFLLINFAKKLVSEGLEVVFAYYPDLVRQIKSSIGNNIEEIIVNLKNVEILMLDDVGAENNTPFVRDDILGPILQYRMDNHLPVFMTSNHSIEFLGKHFMETYNETDKMKSERIIERILCIMNPVELTDKNYRK